MAAITPKPRRPRLTRERTLAMLVQPKMRGGERLCNLSGQSCEPVGNASMTAKNKRKEKIMQNIVEKLFSLIAAISLSGIMFNATIV